jgi:hypothetical protein
MAIRFRPTVTPRSSVPPEPIDADLVETEAPAVSTRWMLWRALFWLMVAFGIQTLASLMPETIETYYSQLAYYHLVRILSTVNKFIPFSLGELLVAGIIVYYLAWTFWYVGRATRREASIIEILKILLLQWAWLFTFGFAIFLFMWGLNYQRQPIEDRLPDLEQRGEGREEIISVGRRIVDGINRNFTTRDAQTATGTSQMTIGIPRLFQVIESGFQLEPMLGAASQGGFANPKPLIFSKLATAFDVRGIYMPYTGEATYNEAVPDCDLPFTIAHVKAHQRGYAREDEANFIAFAVCIKSQEPYVRYSGFLHGLKVLDFLAKSDAQTAASLKSQILPQASADMQARDAYWASTRSSTLTPAANAAINIYLRANRIRGGLKNFSEDTPLIVNYMMRNPDR